MSTYIDLPYRESEEKLSCDTLAHAVEALDALGFCMNNAVVLPMGHYTVLLYEGRMYRESFERFVELPFDSAREDFGSASGVLLDHIFAPFMEKGKVFRSVIHVEEIEDTCGQGFFMHLDLFFEEKKYNAYKTICEALDKVNASEEAVSGTYFLS